MKKYGLLVLPLLLLAGCATDGSKPSCFWKRLTLQECRAQSFFTLDRQTLLDRVKENTQAETVNQLREETPMVSESALYSYRLIGNIRELRAQQDKTVLYLFYRDGKLLDAAANADERAGVYAAWDIPLSNADDLRLKRKYGYDITLSALRNALGTPDETVHYLSPDYVQPVYRLRYGDTDYFVGDGKVIAQTNTESQMREFLAQISAKDPLADEIVITQPKHDPAYPSVSVWDKNAAQLTRLFKNKSRQYVLYSVDNISSKDGVVRSAQGKEYAFVQYGTDGGNYRKFIFRAENPQTFVAAAANVDDVLAVNKRYGVNLGVGKNEFLKRYDGKTAQTNVTDETENKTYEVYKVAYTDVNTKNPQDRWFLFEEDELTVTFETRAAFDAYLNQVSQKNRAGRQAQKEKEAALAAQRQRALEEQRKKEEARKQPVKAILSGGTVQDRMYRPIVTQPKDGKITQPQMIQ